MGTERKPTLFELHSRPTSADVGLIREEGEAHVLKALIIGWVAFAFAAVLFSLVLFSWVPFVVIAVIVGVYLIWCRFVLNGVLLCLAVLLSITISVDYRLMPILKEGFGVLDAFMDQKNREMSAYEGLEEFDDFLKDVQVEQNKQIRENLRRELTRMRNDWLDKKR